VHVLVSIYDRPGLQDLGAEALGRSQGDS
jgi:hypothetical protein